MPINKRKIFILNQVLMDYNQNIYNLLSDDGFKISIAHQLSKSIPQHIDKNINIKYFALKNKFSFLLIFNFIKFNPNLLILSDIKRIDYLLCCVIQKIRGKSCCLATDTHHNLPNSKKNILLKTIFSKFFDFLFIPSEYHKIYARKLGFNNNIYLNLYCANLNRITGLYNNSKKYKNGKINKNFLFIGRFSEEKGVRLLLDAWEKVHKDIDWRLTFIGKGVLKEIILSYENIEVIDYIQPCQYGDLIDRYGCVIFPSINEPWNVTVQEVCALGFPVIASESIPSVSIFVEKYKNGFIYNDNSIDSLASLIFKITTLKDHELLKMSEKSIEFSTRIRPSMTIRSFENLLSKAK